METPPGDEEYNLEEIFPTYKREFDNMTEKEINHYTENCTKISKKICPENDDKFLAPCQKLIHYLKYIKEYPAIVDKKIGCKYFNYMLMDELQKISHSCGRTKECYNTMIYEYSNKSHGVNICKDHIEELNKVIFDKFNDLNSLYDIFYKFTNSEEEGDNRKCQLGRECSEKYHTHISICDKNRNIGFCMALNKFKDAYNDYMKDGPTCENVPRYLYSPFGMGGGPIFFISLITIFAMSITIYTVYKFTPVYSWLHSILRKKSKIRNDLYEESRDLINNDNIKKSNSRNTPLNIQYHSSENS